MVMEEKEIICIICPTGCIVSVTKKDGVLSSTGFTCARGKTYAENEFVLPMRILTSVVSTDSVSEPTLSVRSNRPIPRDKQMECMAEIKNLRVKSPISRHTVLISNILQTGADIVASGDLN